MFNFFQYFPGPAFYYPYNVVIPPQNQSKTPQLKQVPKQKYDLIDDEKRELLIKLTHEQNQPIKQASESLNIKLSTAKAIIKIFKNSGRTDKIKKRKKKTFIKKKVKQVKQSTPLDELRKQLPKLSQETAPYFDPNLLYFSQNYRIE